jgi:uncharacterized protein (DUF2267 family)
MTSNGAPKGDDLVAAVQRRLSLREQAQAEHLLQGVLQGLAYVLPQELADSLCGCVPDDLVWCLRCGPGTPDPLIDSELFLGWVMSSVQTTGGGDRTLGGEDPLASLAGDEARHRARIVLEELLARTDAELSSACCACVPRGLLEGIDPRTAR